MKAIGAKRKKIIVIAIGLIAVILLLWLAQKLLMPKYMSDIYEGAMIAEYYDDSENHNIIFVGDCEVYENISPVSIWESTGLTSWVRGSSQQLVWQSYYILEDTLRYETPDVVVFNVLALRLGEPQDEAYNRMTLDGMKLSMSKINAIKASMTEGESFLSYIFPILRYHSRWSELTSDDIKYMFSRDTVTFGGYLMRADVKPAGAFPTPQVLADYSFPDTSMEYLDKMVSLCKEKGIQLVLVKAPTLYPYYYDEWDDNMEAYAEDKQITYINFLDYAQEIGIDYDTDTYDAGIHLNVYGAEKYSAFLAELLSEMFSFTDYSYDKDVKQHWDNICDAYYKEKEKQEALVSEYGYLKGY